MSDRMSSIIQQYNNDPWDETKLITLIELRRELAALVYDLSKKVRQAAIDYNTAYAIRKVATARYKVEHITAKKTAALSDALAESDAESERLTEAQHEGNYRGGKAVLEAASGVLKSMEQDISFYKKLYDKPE